MHSYIITGIRMGPFTRLLRKHGFSWSPRILARILFVLQNSAWASFHAWRERKTYADRLKDWPVPDDPVIIIGHWRTGSTLLHFLLSRDPRFIAPSLFQVTVPEGFLVSDRYYRPVMGAMVGRRPMDNVMLKFDDPQEDEFALLKLTGESPLLKLIFPGQPGFFFSDQADFNPSPGNKEHWQQQLRNFCRKVVRDSGRRLLLKNPAHSLRIPLLCETFPNARFIYIHRHPCDVVPSSLHLWKVMARDNRLKGKPYSPTTEEVTDALGLFYEVIHRDLAALSKERYCEVSYESLQADPMGETRRIYRELGMDLSAEAEGRMMAYLDGARDFRKNSYTFDEAGRKLVYDRLKKHFERYKYPI